MVRRKLLQAIDGDVDGREDDEAAETDPSQDPDALADGEQQMSYRDLSLVINGLEKELPPEGRPRIEEASPVNVFAALPKESPTYIKALAVIIDEYFDARGKITAVSKIGLLVKGNEDFLDKLAALDLRTSQEIIRITGVAQREMAITAARLDLLSQIKISKMIGVHQATISRWIKGRVKNLKYYGDPFYD